MGLFSRFRRRRTPYRAASEEERIARYVYLLNTLPASVIESAHAAAFKELSPARRRELFEQLRPFMAPSEQQATSDDASLLARLVRRAEEHRTARSARHGQASAETTVAVVDERAVDTDPTGDPRDGVDPRSVIASAGVLALVAQNFLVSSAVMSYYTVGAGSLMIGSEPAWVGESYDPGAAAFDGGGFAGDGGGGFDGGGFGGGVDAGGLGGGFDGGGGFGG
jgi:hypothetical protein